MFTYLLGSLGRHPDSLVSYVLGLSKRCLNCGEAFRPARSSAKFCSTNCRVTFNRDATETSDESVPFEEHGENPGVLIKSEYVGRQGNLYVYHETFERDNGGTYRLRQLSQWSPAQINKLRTMTSTTVRVSGHGEAAEAPALKYERKGPALK